MRGWKARLRCGFVLRVFRCAVRNRAYGVGAVGKRVYGVGFARRVFRCAVVNRAYGIGAVGKRAYKTRAASVLIEKGKLL